MGWETVDPFNQGSDVLWRNFRTDFSDMSEILKNNRHGRRHKRVERGGEVWKGAKGRYRDVVEEARQVLSSWNFNIMGQIAHCFFSLLFYSFIYIICKRSCLSSIEKELPTSQIILVFYWQKTKINRRDPFVWILLAVSCGYRGCGGDSFAEDWWNIGQDIIWI